MSMIGHNTPVGAALSRNYDALLKRRDELLDAMERVPLVVLDDKTQQKVGDMANQFADLIDQAEAARATEKRPFLENGQIVDQFFNNGLRDPLGVARKHLRDLGTQYLTKKRKQAEEEARHRAAELAEQAEIAAEAALALASHGADDTKLKEKASVAMDAAAAITTDMASKTAGDLVRTQSESGGLSTLRERWVCTGVDIATVDLEALREYLSASVLLPPIRQWMKKNKAALDQGNLLRGAAISLEAEADYRR